MPLLQVNDRKIAPLGPEVLEDEPPVAALGRRFAAQQRRGNSEPLRIDLPLHAAVRHELQETPLVLAPVPFAFLIRLQQWLGRRQPRFMDIVGVAKRLQEEFQVGPLGEPGELRRVVEPHVKDPSDPGLSQCSEELGRGFLGKTDCVDRFHEAVSS